MALYRRVLRSPAAPLAVHAEGVGWTARRAERVFRTLERLGLARETPQGSVSVDDPRVTVGRLLDSQEAELDERRQELLVLRESLAALEDDYRHGLQLSGPRAPMVQRVAPAESAGVVEQLFRTSTGSVLQVTGAMDAGPAHEDTVRRRRDEGMAEGRPMLSIFPLSVLEDPYWRAYAEERARAGEQQRYLPDDQIGVEFGIFGRSGVLVAGGGPGDDLILLRPRRVVDAFVTLFEELWRRAEPVPNGDAEARDVRLLELLALGFKDEAVARQLGVGLRTVRRRVAALMDEHGADTRFQLGLALGRRGLLDSRRG
ncbi:hypothetical protein DV701_14075 [Ornithinimicrobium avium]|uniref:HTH luxR-type domain-containing protein n=1 Tax=Ornithinimicrobium avium TaxID=2283195 RepID=A0A345NPY5_9MICO|nr:hypothetical protein DV701_14075 [Ornithinimicrobium avium]